jgi:hypothetical protein
MQTSRTFVQGPPTNQDLTPNSLKYCHFFGRLQFLAKIIIHYPSFQPLAFQFTSTVNPSSSILHPPSSVLHPPSSVLCPPSSVLHPPSSILHPPSTILHPPSTILRQPSTISSILAQPQTHQKNIK